MLWRQWCRVVLVQCLEALPPHEQTCTILATIRILKTHELHILNLLSVLRNVKKLCGSLPSRSLHLFDNYQLLSQAVLDIKALADLGPEVSELRDALVVRLQARFPSAEAQ